MNGTIFRKAVAHPEKFKNCHIYYVHTRTERDITSQMLSGLRSQALFFLTSKNVAPLMSTILT